MSTATLAGRSDAGFVAKTVALVRKDLRIETRSRDTLPPMLAFSLAVTLLLAFTLPTTTRLTSPLSTPAGTVPLVDVLSGFLWITILFAGLIGFARTFEVERAEGAVDSLLLVPVDRSSLFLAKTMANLTYVIVVQLFLVPVFLLLFQVSLGSGWVPLVGVLFLVDIGFVAIGTLFSALAARTRSRELMLPILALPALVPIFIAAVELTSDLLLGGGFTAIAERGWFGILVAFDVIFGVLGALAFEYALDA
ncbi:MAG TPA: heme exporter protein CcmB [Actinomycetota bacterium]|nr:heme exporter protein CcmB [Actinomycetota bacterium]